MRGPDEGPSDPEEGVGLAGSSSTASVGVALNMLSKSELVTDVSAPSRARRRGAADSEEPATGADVGMSGVDDMPAAAAGTAATGAGADAGVGVDDALAPVDAGLARGGVLPRLELAEALPLGLVTGACAGTGAETDGATGAEVGTGVGRAGVLAGARAVVVAAAAAGAEGAATTGVRLLSSDMKIWSNTCSATCSSYAEKVTHVLKRFLCSDAAVPVP